MFNMLFNYTQLNNFQKIISFRNKLKLSWLSQLPNKLVNFILFKKILEKDTKEKVSRKNCIFDHTENLSVV